MGSEEKGDVLEYLPQQVDRGSKSDLSADISKSEDSGASLTKKGQPWTEAEHLAFLAGLKKIGRGNWRGISRYFVPSRTPTQVASHAQKHFMRIEGITKRRSRFSVNTQQAQASGEIPTSMASTSGSRAPNNGSQTAQNFTVPYVVPSLMVGFPFVSPPVLQSQPGTSQGGSAIETMAKQGSGFPWFATMQAIQALQAPVLAAIMQSRGGGNSSWAGILKPEPFTASVEETSNLLNKLPMSNCTNTKLFHSPTSAFKPLVEPQA